MEMESNLVKGYSDAYQLACRKLIKKDIAQTCHNAAVSFNNEKKAYLVGYLGRTYQISVETGGVERLDSDTGATATEKVLLLHYLLHASDEPVTGQRISFRELKNGGSIYYPAFYKRAVLPLIKTFGEKVEDLYIDAEKLGGRKEKFGHASVTIQVLPKVPVTYVLWEGEDDISASGTILFDSSVEYYLPDEDIVCAGSFGVYELMRLKKERESMQRA